MSQALLLSPLGPHLPASEPESGPLRQRLTFTSDQLTALGQLLRAKRKAARLSRARLAREAKLSDCTIKFIENALHSPRRATLQSLIEVAALKLAWRDVPGHQGPPTTPNAQEP